MLCAICGCPVRPPPQRPAEVGVEGLREQQRQRQQEDTQLQWLSKAVMLSDPAEEFETLEQHYRAGKKPGVPELAFARDDEEIQKDKVTVTTTDECILERDGSRIRPNWGAGLDEAGGRHRGSTPYGIVVHEACLDITEMAMRKSRRPVRVRSMRTLWKVLRMRHDTYDNLLMGGEVVGARDTSSLATNIYYLFMEPEPHPGSDWRDPFRTNYGDWLLENPTTTPDLSIVLHDKLHYYVQPVEYNAADPKTEAFRHRFLNLPLELRQHILDLLSSCDDLHLTRTRLLPREAWRNMLLGKRFLPFLHDLDEAAVLRYVQQYGRKRETKIDWEQLVRILSRGAWVAKSKLDYFCNQWDPRQGYYYCGFPASIGLCNRRRIWQVVEEMFVGDLLPYEGSGASVPRYWDEYGERVYPVIRLSG
ncbi:hypothetical protein PG994_012728 [Apiospora phragmitis]|uniref:F-box domain-containing protein n=1 Tax=Apiospora phragmitis TaxID=2905665 RepID=A0ABR1TBA7_9PEZI